MVNNASSIICECRTCQVIVAATFDNLIILDSQWTYSRVVGYRNTRILNFHFWNVNSLSIVNRVNLTNNLVTSSSLKVD